MDELEDSPDLTDDEILGAIDSESVVIPDLKCPECGAESRGNVQLRRRRPFLYSRVIQTCLRGHVTAHVFRLIGPEWRNR